MKAEELTAEQKQALFLASMAGASAMILTRMLQEFLESATDADNYNSPVSNAKSLLGDVVKGKAQLKERMDRTVKNPGGVVTTGFGRINKELGGILNGLL